MVALVEWQSVIFAFLSTIQTNRWAKIVLTSDTKANTTRIQCYAAHSNQKSITKNPNSFVIYYRCDCTVEWTHQTFDGAICSFSVTSRHGMVTVLLNFINDLLPYSVQCAYSLYELCSCDFVLIWRPDAWKYSAKNKQIHCAGNIHQVTIVLLTTEV